MMRESSIDLAVFSAHSTSKALASSVPLSTILKTAGWSKGSTFAKFNRKDFTDNAADLAATAK